MPDTADRAVAHFYGRLFATAASPEPATAVLLLGALIGVGADEIAHISLTGSFGSSDYDKIDLREIKRCEVTQTAN